MIGAWEEMLGYVMETGVTIRCRKRNPDMAIKDITNLSMKDLADRDLQV